MSVTMHLLWILPWALSAVYLGSPRFLGSMAPSRTKRLLAASLRAPEYRIWNDLDLGNDRSRTRCDHVVISRCGVHVIDSLHVSGRIKGTDVQSHWKAITGWRKREFDNPVHANHLRIQALAQALELPISRFQGVVALSGNFRLSAGTPGNVIAAGKLVDRLRTRAPEVFTADQIHRIAKRLEEVRISASPRRRAVLWKSVQMLLFIGLVATALFVFRKPLGEIAVRLQLEMASPTAGAGSERASRMPSKGGQANSGLICAYSADTGRCACHQPGGGKVEIEMNRCRELAERGSVLKN